MSISPSTRHSQALQGSLTSHLAQNVGFTARRLHWWHFEPRTGSISSIHHPAPKLLPQEQDVWWEHGHEPIEIVWLREGHLLILVRGRMLTGRLLPACTSLTPTTPGCLTTLCTFRLRAFALTGLYLGSNSPPTSLGETESSLSPTSRLWEAPLSSRIKCSFLYPQNNQYIAVAATSLLVSWLHWWGVGAWSFRAGILCYSTITKQV